MSVQKPVPFSATCCVVQIREPQVVPELVREHTDAAVLRLDGVVTHPEIRSRKVVTSEMTPLGSEIFIEIRVPPMTPDRVAALRAAACFLAHARMHDAEVIDIAIRLSENAVPVAIVPVDLIGVHEVETAVISGCRQRLQRVVDDPIGGAVRIVATRSRLGCVFSEFRFSRIHLNPVGHLARPGESA